MIIESIMERIRDKISLDYLARVLVDVHQVSFSRQNFQRYYFPPKSLKY